MRPAYPDLAPPLLSRFSEHAGIELTEGVLTRFANSGACGPPHFARRPDRAPYSIRWMV